MSKDTIISDIQNDILEMAGLLSATYPNNLTGDTKQSSFCISRICEKSDDMLFNGRSIYISENLKDFDTAFVKGIQTLSADCCKEKPVCEKCCISKYCNHFINNQITNVDSSAQKFIDLFCGAGGLSLGFRQEDYVLNLANDIEPCCIDTYSHNHPETPRKHIVLGDINEVISSMEKLLRFKTTDVVIGGPPCQGFSMANRQRLIDDPRNYLYKSYVKVVDMIKPKFFIMENVKGMLPVINQVKDDFINIGYTVSANVVNAKDFGIPQNRERLIFIGNRIGINNDIVFDDLFKYAAAQEGHVLADALYGLKPLKASTIRNSTNLDTEESGSRFSATIEHDTNSYIDTINQNRRVLFVLNHKARYNNDRDIEIYRRLFQGDKSNDPKIADIMPYSSRNHIFTDKYFKLEADKVCKTITAHMKFDCNMYIHPTQDRGLTPREAARVQSYPDDYFFRGAYTKTYMQIGNSVPPLLGRALANTIKKYIR